MLSFFITNISCHIYSNGVLQVHKVTEQHKMADLIPLFLSSELRNLDKVIFPLGPLSFTTVRVVNSVIKALKIACPKTQFIGVSNFLTYFYAVNGICDAVAINSYRGDFYYRAVMNGKLLQQETATFEELKTQFKNPVFDTNLIENNTNLAFTQFTALYRECKDKELICETTDIAYAFTPKYRKLGE